MVSLRGWLASAGIALSLVSVGISPAIAGGVATSTGQVASSTAGIREGVTPSATKVRPRATLSAAFTVLASGKVRVEARSNAKKVRVSYRTAKNKKVATTITIRGGKASKTLAKGSHRISAQAKATSKLRASRKIAVLSTEAQWVSLAAPAIAYTPGANRFASTLLPAVTGRRVFLQLSSQGQWVNIASAVEGARGVVAWAPTLTGTGSVQVRAYAPATTSLPATQSSSATVSLRQAPPAGPKRSLQVAESLTVGSTEPVDLPFSPVTTAVARVGDLPAEVSLTVADGSLSLEASNKAVAGSYRVHVSGTACSGDACGTPYDLEIALTVAPASDVSRGIDQFVDPSSDRAAAATGMPGGVATALPDELLVVIGSDTDPGTVGDAQSIADQVGAVVTGGLEDIGVYQLRWTTKVDLAQRKSTLQRIAGVAAVEPSALLGDLDLAVTPPGDWADDWEAVKWPFTQMRLPQAWDTTTGGAVSVGVLEDDAVYSKHEDLNVTEVRGSGKPGLHATHVAGLACAKGNGKGLVGAAWGCPIVSGTFATNPSDLPGGKDYGALVANVLKGAEDLAGTGVGVINMSIGDNNFRRINSTTYEHCLDKTTSDAWQRAEQSMSGGFRRLFNSETGRGVVWTISAGNNCASGVTSAWGVSWALPNVITVAASNRDKTLASFSNFGPGVEVAAPGGVAVGISGGADGLWSTTVATCGPFSWGLCGSYGAESGTSMSAPLVAGVAELAMSAAPRASAAEVGSCIVATAGTRTGTITRRSPTPTKATSGATTTRFTPSASIPYDGTSRPIPIVDAEAAVKCAQSGQGKADVLITGMGDRTSSGNGTDRGDLFAALTARNYKVQVSDALPPDLSKYGQVWYLDTVALSASDTARLEAYVSKGGSAYLTGERPCCTDSNTVIAVINALTSDTVAYGGELSTNHFLVSKNPYGITSNPHAITYIDPTAPGTLTGVSAAHAIAGTSGRTVWAAYGPSDVTGGGRLVAVMDINYLAVQYRSANWGDIADNIAHFLGKPTGTLAVRQSPATVDAPRENRSTLESGDPNSTTG